MRHLALLERWVVEFHEVRTSDNVVPDELCFVIAEVAHTL